MNYPSNFYLYNYIIKRRCLLAKIFSVCASLFICILILALSTEQANSRDLISEVKAAYIYNFTKFVNWAEESDGSTKTSIKICVIGTDPIGDILEELSYRQVEGHPLKVEIYTSDISNLPRCQVLFICRSEEQQLPRILKQLAGSNVLTASDIPRFSKRGGMIGFVTEGGRVKIEINLRVAQQAGLKISAKLLEVSRIIQ
jgi:hypothetical protein